jgi:hypothetical protein
MTEERTSPIPAEGVDAMPAAFRRSMALLESFGAAEQ